MRCERCAGLVVAEHFSAWVHPGRLVGALSPTYCRGRKSTGNVLLRT